MTSTLPRSREDDPAATERIWREFGGRLRAFVQRRIVDPHRADDVVSEILLRIHTHLHQLDDRENITSWVFRIARNAVIDEYRRAGRDRERLESDVPDAPATVPQLWDEDQATVLNELATCLRPMLDGLSPEQRRAVELTELQGLTQARAAVLESVSVSGMKSRVQRGRHQLAELLGQCCALTLDARGIPMGYTAPAGCGCRPTPD